MSLIVKQSMWSVGLMAYGSGCVCTAQCVRYRHGVRRCSKVDDSRKQLPHQTYLGVDLRDYAKTLGRAAAAVVIRSTFTTRVLID